MREPARPARTVIAIGSGKGGVGKSTISLNLALALAEDGSRVGLLDADFTGPNIPLMVGLKRDRWTVNWTMAERRREAHPPIPPTERYGLQIMSAGFILGEDQPLLIDAGTTSFLSRQLIRDVAWGELDYLLVDLPPGTADTQQILLRQLALSGAILVVTPQDVAHLDGRKALGMFGRARVRLLGGVENMSGYICPHCGGVVDVFSRVQDDRSIWRLGVDRLGEIPIDPSISRAGDSGTPLLAAHPDSPQADAFRRIASAVRERVAGSNGYFNGP